MMVSDVLLGLSLALLALMLFSHFTAGSEGDPLRMDIVAVTGLLLVATYLCHLKAW